MSYSPKKGLNIGSIIFGVVVVIVLVGVLMPMRLIESPMSNRGYACLNAKEIAQGLIDFKNEFGAYPCGFTRETLEELGHKNLPPGNSANAYLAQLIVTGQLEGKEYFYVRGMSNSVKGDDDIDSPEKLLAKGENGFSYIMVTDEEPLTDVSSKTPIVITSLIRGGENPTFDRVPFAGYCVYGTADGSARQLKIDEEGRALHDGKPLFATGEDSLFGEDIPVIKLPR